MMRRLLWFSLGFAGVCGLCAYGMNRPWVLAAGTAVLLTAVIVLALGRRARCLRPGIALLMGFLSGLVWFCGYHYLYLRPLTVLDGELVSLSVTASDYSYDTGWRTGVDGVTTIGGRPYQVRAYVDAAQILAPGDVVQGTFRLRLTTGEDASSAYFQGKGIFLQLYHQGTPQITEGQGTPLWCFPAVLRQQIRHLLEAVFPEDTAPFARALLLGDSRGLDYETDTALKISGIRHIIAVSGLHISILYGALSMITLKRRYLTALVGIPALLLWQALHPPFSGPVSWSG